MKKALLYLLVLTLLFLIVAGWQIVPAIFGSSFVGYLVVLVATITEGAVFGTILSEELNWPPLIVALILFIAIVGGLLMAVSHSIALF